LTLETDPDLRANLTAMLEANDHIATLPARARCARLPVLAWYNVAGRAYNREGCGGLLDLLLSA
jgi:hypothetical protein